MTFQPWGQFQVAHHINPPPPNHPIEIILAFGPQKATLVACAHLAQGIGFKHLAVLAHVHKLNISGDKTKLGLLHTRGLKRYFALSKWPPAGLMLPVIKIMIDEEVEKGGRKFVMTGMLARDREIQKFIREIAVPSAFVFFYEPGDHYDVRRTSIERAFGSKAVIAPVLGDEGETYAALLGRMGEKAMAVRETKKVLVRPVEVIDLPNTDVEMEEDQPTRTDSAMDMITAANAALRKK